MKGDFTRFTFDPSKHYRGVVMQQGRVTLDADWNENLGIEAHQLQTLGRDVIGECGVPVHVDAFKIEAPAIDLNSQALDFQINAGPAGKGRMYVSGLLTEIEQDTTYLTQPDWLSSPLGTTLAGLGPTLPDLKDGETRVDQVYIDVWRRVISAIEDPHLREVALGGPDTAERIKLVWQVKVNAGVDSKTNCNTSVGIPALGGGLLNVVVTPQPIPPDPCEPTAQGGYTGPDNRLYRIEIHNGGPLGSATYKWSRDNGSVLASIQQFKSATEVVVRSLGKDDYLKFKTGDWVEVSDDAIDLSGLPGTLAQITVDEASRTLTLSLPLPDAIWKAADRHAKVRRWDGGDAQSIAAGVLNIEAGIQVEFTATADDFRTGDYWTFAARVIDGSLDPTLDQPRPPMGVLHASCNLALITWTRNGNKASALVQDCRLLFPPLTELPAGGETCCTVTVGVQGDYPDLQSALEARSANSEWWTVCILPGIVNSSDTVQVSAAINLTISGCGVQSRLVAPMGKPLLAFADCRNIKLEGLSIEASSPSGALLFEGCSELIFTNNVGVNLASLSTNLALERIGPAGPFLVIDGSTQIRIQENELYGLPAIRAQGSEIEITDNRILGGGVEVNPPSFDLRIVGNAILKGQGPGIQLGGGDKSGSDFVAMYYPAQEAAPVMTEAGSAKGAATQTKPGSPEIAGGVTLASAPVPISRNALAAIRRVTIAANLIGGMTGSGILTETNLANAAKLGDVEMLVIRDNQIVGCASSPDLTLSSSCTVGGGIAAIGLFSTQIVDNYIVDNGLGKQEACGIFILDGSDVDIVGNVIAENGTVDDPTQTQPPSAYQAGIAIQYVVGNYLGTFASKENPKAIESSLIAGFPAARVLSNQVICPAGQALTISTLGSVMVEGNTFTTREVKRQPVGPLNFQVNGACVALLDMGVPIWLSELSLGLKMMSSGLINLHLTDFQQADTQAARYPDGRVIFNNNTISFNTDQQGDVTSLDPLDATWPQRAWGQATFAALFMSLDDLSISGNQFQSTVPLYAFEGLQKYQAGGMTLGDLLAYLLKFIQVGSAGSIIRATSNGLSERLYSNSISYASNATAMDITTSNTATHAFVTNAPKKAEANNLSLT